MNSLIRVGPYRVVAMRYVMKNETQEVVVNTMEDEPVTFMFGSGEILPGLEQPLTGLKIGERKSFSLSPEDSPGLDQIFYFDVIIDDIRWEPEGESKNLNRSLKQDVDLDTCGPDCDC